MVNDGTCAPDRRDFRMPISRSAKGDAHGALGRRPFENIALLLEDGEAFAVQALRAADGHLAG